MSKVLLVEDDPEKLYYMDRVARGPGREISTAASSREAAQKIRSEEFDLIVTDLSLEEGRPGLNVLGLEVLREARKKDPFVPLILVTAYATPEVSREAMSLEVFDYIDRNATGYKPLDMLKYKIGLALKYGEALRAQHTVPL